jgi:hypothetical protein
LPPVTTDLAPITQTSTTSTVEPAPPAPPSPSLPAPHDQTFAPPPEEASADATVEAVSLTAQNSMSQCGVETPPCIADALDAYADAIERLSPQLPPRLRALPAIIRNAAKKVRAARSSADARKIVKVAMVEVRKLISLQVADDPPAVSATRDGAAVVATLRVADLKLQRATGL